MERLNFSLSKLKEIIGPCSVVFAKEDRVLPTKIIPKGCLEDIVIDNRSLESLSFRDLREKLTALILCFKKQEEVIGSAKSDAHTIDTLLANVNNKGLTDAQFREFVRTLEFNQKIKEE